MKQKGNQLRHFLFATLSASNRVPLGLAGLAMLWDALLTVMRPWPLKVVIDRVIPNSSKPVRVPFITSWLNDPALDRLWILYGACAATILIAVGTGLLTYWYTRKMGEISQNYVYALRASLFAHMQRLSLGFHDRRRIGDLITRLTSDVQSIQDVIANQGVILLSNLLLLFGMVVMMMWLNWGFALIALAVAPILFFSIYKNTHQIRSASRRARTSTGKLASLAQETLASIRIVQGLAQEDQLDGRFAAQSNMGLEAYLDGVKYQAAVAPIVDILAAVGLCLVMWYGATRVMTGELTIGDLVVFFAYVTNLYAPMRALSKSANSTARALVAMERIVEVLTERSEVAEIANAPAIQIGQGGIEFRDVSFAYPGRPRTLEGINLLIKPGETVAIVGATGTGKSTLVSMVPRLYDPVEGQVLIDRQDLRRVAVKSLRSQISMVLQESLLFSGTVRENIAFGCPGASDHDIVVAARLANADDFIRALPEGYDTEISEGGTTLSGGQRQRISIARACLRNSPILIFDEPTSGLDVISERAVITALGAASKGRTVLIIAHRLAAVCIADRIVVMERGRIAEIGTHQQLLSARGIYAQLVAMQQAQTAAQARVGAAV